MHELSLAESVVRIVEATAQKNKATRVTKVRLGIGALAHIEADTLRFCCELASRQTILADALFEVEQTAGQAHCNACRHDVALEKIGFPCPQCGSFNLTVTAGEEMQVLAITIV